MANSMTPFNAQESENIQEWILNTRFIFETYGLSEDDDKLRLTILLLKNKALEWTREFINSRTEPVSFDYFCREIVKRFTSNRFHITLMQNFIAGKKPKTHEEFKKFWEEAQIIYDYDLVPKESLENIIIRKLPMEIKAPLYLISQQNCSWFEFKNSGIKYSEFVDSNPTEHQINCNQSEKETLVNLNHLVNNKSKRLSQKYFCEIHGKANHPTEKCRKYNSLRDISTRGSECKVKLLPRISAITSGNPFFIYSKIHNKDVQTLVDTGADVSIINKSYIPKNTYIEPYYGSVKTANGGKMNIIGKINSLEIHINNKNYCVHNVLVVGEQPRYFILSSKFVIDNPEIILSLLKIDIQKELRKEATSFKNKNKVRNVEENKDNLVKLELIKNKFNDIFQTEIDKMNLCSTGLHSIDTGSAKPIAKTNFRIPINYEKEITEDIEKNLKLGILRPSKSPWCSRLVPVDKKDGSLRLCVDYRPLNSVTTKDSYPIPRIDEILDSLSKASIFTTLDATKGYYQIALNEADIEKTAFAWKGGLYEYTRMPFGLCNAPATFQRAMDAIFRKESWNFVIPYFDDIIIFSENMEDHYKHLEIVLGKLKAAGVSLNPKKCIFAKQEITILGNVICKNAVKPDPLKTRAIYDYARPTTIKQLRSFLGLANFCRSFVPRFSEIASPLFEFLKGESKTSNKTLQWSKEQDSSFKNLKNSIAAITSRAQPDFDKKFILITDASESAIGSILAQKDDSGEEKMIYAFSKSLEKAQKNYSITDKELLAVVKSIEHFRHYLLGREFILRTDHRALTYLWETKNPSARLLRWSLKLQEYSFIPEYIKGELNAADGLSRQNQDEVKVCSIKQDLTSSQKNAIMEEYHQISGHGSANTIKFLIKERYSWKGMFKDIDDFISKCKTCLQSGESRVNTKNRIIESSGPNDIWECDLIGKLDCTAKGNQYIFVAIDHYTKWIETRVLKSKDSENILKAIKELIIDKHGIPNKIISDYGLEFNNKHIKELQRIYMLEWAYCSPGHHKTIGAIERVNKTLFEKIKKLCKFGELQWDRVVEAATFGVNISYNRSIQTSPFILKFGRVPLFQIDKELNQAEILKQTAILRQKRDEHFKHYAERDIKKGKVIAKDNFIIGDHVLVYKKILGDKLGSKWKPGFIIVDKILPDAYIVTNGHSRIRLNKAHLKLDSSKTGEGDVACAL